MKSYVCVVCGYVYNPVDGDSYSGIPNNIEFNSLSENWICPFCGFSKYNFVPLE
ncbi:rubredoxin [Clostridium hydrogeniformans]|uniref:rubredoxin n=1 Tax=Clostridium hydrogeniformans TaxID=349933 RepID=UPI000A0385E0|nr:rubredoxin [Clostridium hydrogeniformans]